MAQRNDPRGHRSHPRRSSQKRISVQTERTDGLPLIRGDRVQLQEVILNLIINAVEAMHGVEEGAR